MPDDLYRTDILAWSAAQAERLRRLAAGERVNDVDWANVIEEVESVGRSELNAVRSNLGNAFVHALKLVGWPDHPAADHWRGELVAFLSNARRRMEPGMAQHLDIPALYAEALADTREMTLGGAGPGTLPEAITLEPRELLERRFTAASLLARLAPPR